MGAAIGISFLVPTQPSPEPAGRGPLDGAGDIRGDPSTIEFSWLGRHALVIDKAAVKRPRVKGDVVAQGSEGRVRIGTALGHIAQRFAAHDDIKVDRFGLPLADRSTARGLYDEQCNIIRRKARGGRMTCF
jgi:hypothetical protein